MSPPERIGRYAIVDVLGRGAMGVVYRGRDEGLDRDVAVKVVRDEAVDEESRAQFLKEARAAARLQHPGIVTIYELGDHEGAPYMAMELLDGQDLQRAMRDGTFASPAAALAVVEQVLAALGHAHARGIVHRDMKPSNVFLHAGTQAKILDFGVARLGEGLTVTGRLVGTPHYMSPEQIRAEPVDGRSDLFSTALMFYEMVTGAKPYRPGSAVTVMYQIVNEDADLSRLPKTATGAALTRVLRRALARDRNERYPDAAALAVALAAAARAHLDEPECAPEVLPELDIPDLTPIAPLRFPREEPPPEPPRRPEHSWPDLALRTPMPHERPLPVTRRRSWVPAVVLLLLAAAGGWWWRMGGLAPTSDPSLAPSTAPSLEPPLSTVGAPPEAVATAAPPSTRPPSTTMARALEPTTPPRVATPFPPAPAAPMDAPARLEKADQLFQSGRLGAALAEARAVLREQPDNAEAKYLVDDIELDLAVEGHLKRARAALARGDRQTARREAEEGLRAKPSESRLGALLRELER